MQDLAHYLFSTDWQAMFTPTISITEAFLRISIVYLSLYFLLRVVLKREAGSLAVTDMLVVVLLADAVQNAMASDYKSITDGLVLAVTLVFWDWSLNYISFRWRPAQRVLYPAPLLLIRDGRMLRSNLGKELMSEDELLSQLRLQGVASVEDVRFAFVEPDGRISVVPKEGKQGGGRHDDRHTA